MHKSRADYLYKQVTQTERYSFVPSHLVSFTLRIQAEM